MQEIIRLTNQYGLLLVFLGVLLESLGFPLPAMPLLIVAGAFVVAGSLSGVAVFALALLAGLIGNLVWFFAGRRYGNKVMKFLCRISLSPDSCVRQTQSLYEHWGARMLLVAKFVPGLSTIAAPLAGAMRLGLLRFIAFCVAGDAIWTAASLAAGALLHSQIELVGVYLARFGVAALALLGALFALFLAFKWWERRRFNRSLRMARISIEELQQLLHGGSKPLILDVRSETARKLDAHKIPGAFFVDINKVDEQLVHLQPGVEVIVYCSCPSEASAARVARMLMDRGVGRVRPLAGGLDAWLAAGHPVEPVQD